MKTVGEGEHFFVRTFCEEDQTRAKEIITTGLKEHWGAIYDPKYAADVDDIYSHYMQRVHAIFLVACADGQEIIGTVVLLPATTTENARSEGWQNWVVRIVRVSVAKEWRRNGVGRKLVSELSNRAKEFGCRTVVMETTTSWTDSVHFWQSSGFSRIGESGGDTHFVRFLASDESDGCENHEHRVNVLKKHLRIVQ